MMNKARHCSSVSNRYNGDLLTVPTLTGIHDRAPKHHYRIVVMGGPGVGKSNIISQFLYEEFIAEYKKTIEDLHHGKYEIDGKHLTLDILDTSGAFDFPAMRHLSIATGDAFVLVYSIDDESSFEDVKRLHAEIIAQKDGNEHIPIVIVGNKSDMISCDRTISKLVTEATVNIDWGIGYVEASAKDNINIVGIFKELLKQANAPVELYAAITKRRMSLPLVSKSAKKTNKMLKRESCVVS